MTAREQAVYAGLRRKQGGTKDVIDVSQSADWSRIHQDVSPTVTPGARIWVAEVGRFVSPLEKMLLHLIPAHELLWPQELTKADIADFGGNTMHLMAAHGLASRAHGTIFSELSILWCV